MRLATLLLAVALAACGTSAPPPSFPEDAGPLDAALPDAGAGSDASGIDVPADASTPEDSGPGAQPDAAAGLDAASAPDAGAPDGSAGPTCAPRPFVEDDHLLEHYSHPVKYGVKGPLQLVVDSSVVNPEWPDHHVTVFRPEGTAAYPVLFYSHPYGGSDPESQRELFERLASNGYNLVFVPYQASGGRLKQYATLWRGFLEAVAAFGDKFDLTRVGFVGHSFGGGATPELARRAFGAPTENGLTAAWGSAGRMMFIMAPWFSYPNLANPTADNDHFHQLPVDVKTVVQVYGDDDVNDHQIAVHDIWEKLPPGLAEKGWMLVESDSCDGFQLNAGHTTPATYNTAAGGPGTGNNAHDEWATARRIHALADYAFTGSAVARALAFPATSEGVSLGHWVGHCGDRPVAPLKAGAAPIVSACSGLGGMVFGYSPAAHCKWSATGEAGGPPCR